MMMPVSGGLSPSKIELEKATAGSTWGVNKEVLAITFEGLVKSTNNFVDPSGFGTDEQRRRPIANRPSSSHSSLLPPPIPISIDRPIAALPKQLIEIQCDDNDDADDDDDQFLTKNCSIGPSIGFWSTIL